MYGSKIYILHPNIWVRRVSRPGSLILPTLHPAFCVVAQTFINIFLKCILFSLIQIKYYWLYFFRNLITALLLFDLVLTKSGQWRSFKADDLKWVISFCSAEENNTNSWQNLRQISCSNQLKTIKRNEAFCFVFSSKYNYLNFWARKTPSRSVDFHPDIFASFAVDFEFWFYKKIFLKFEIEVIVVHISLGSLNNKVDI